ncbi:MAG: TldD/PmbA family protein [Elusimicrobia bacterium]|nr:TldD/PmbA family protein [Elusimicrobiota bacterium]
MSLLPAVKGEDFAGLLGGAQYGEAFLEQSEATSIRFEDSRVEDIASSAEKGLSLRYLRRIGASSEVETLQGSAQGLDAEAASLLRRGLLGSKAKAAGVALAPLNFWRHSVRVDPGQIPLEAKIKLLSDIDREIRSGFPHIRQVSLSLAERRRDVVIINSEGAHVREERTTVLFAANVIAEDNGVLQTGHEVIGGLKGWEILEDSDPGLAARGAARRALEKLSAPKAKAGEMPIVLSSSAGGTFIHEAIGHSLEVDHVQEGSSPHYIGKLGHKVAPENITVIDDPTLPFHRGSFRFDDEGVEAKPTTLVKDGVLVDYLYDRVSALREAKPSNGHGRRESFACRPIPRMSNLYIAPGTDAPKEIIKSLKAGVFVTKMGGGQVNTATGEFVFEVDEGFWVEDGKVRHLVRDANLLGIGPDILMSIDQVGWDIGWGIGTCGKDGQGVPVGDGQPTLRIPKILIGGRHD